MTFPQQPQYQQYPQPQYPQQARQPNRNPYADWLRRVHRNFSRIGASLCLMVVIWYAFATLAEGVLHAALGGGDMPNWATYVGSGVPLYLLAMPAAVLIMGRSTVIETRKFDMRPGMFFKLLLMCFPLIWLGGVIGNMLSMLLSDGQATDSVSELAMQLNVWNVVFLVVVGPVFEEWLFRKQLIDRIRKYGEKTAIVFSALAFGLFHMNLFQFFYAFALGLMFGYVYMRTSKLRYSVAMHMIVNFNGGVLAPWVLSRVDLEQLDKMASSAGQGNEAAMVQWIASNGTGLAIMLVYFLLYGAVMIAGLVLLARNFKRFEFYTAPEELPRGMRARTAFGNVGVITFIVVTVILTAINLLL